MMGPQPGHATPRTETQAYYIGMLGETAGATWLGVCGVGQVCFYLPGNDSSAQITINDMTGKPVGGYFQAWTVQTICGYENTGGGYAEWVCRQYPTISARGGFCETTSISLPPGTRTLEVKLGLLFYGAAYCPTGVLVQATSGTVDATFT